MKLPICHKIIYENGKIYEFISSIGKYVEIKFPKILAYLAQGEEVKMENNYSPFPLNVIK
jgi:hypothetical protein